MLILALDTTTTAGSCAISREGRAVRETASDRSKPQASRLPHELATLLEVEGVRLTDVDAFAVGIGPGSFTGLRIGIAAMQGLAFACGRPLVGVSALDALARIADEAGTPGLVCAWVDAWRGEVYASTYDGRVARGSPVVARPERLLRELQEYQAVLFTGDGAQLHQSAIRDALGSRALFTEPLVPMLAGAMAGLASDVLRAGDRPGPHAVRPLYVRRPDAELARRAAPDRGVPVPGRTS